DNIAQSGGGMYLIDGGTSVLQMKGGSFTNNKSLEAWGIGGAIVCQNSSFGIYDSVIQDNSAEGADSSGGGIDFYDGEYASHTVQNCLITGNSAVGNGGAISCEIFTGPDILNCTFSGNSVLGHGGGIYVDWSSTFLGDPPTHVTNCIFDDCDNQAIYEGGSASDVTVETCDFYNNQHSDYYDFDTFQILDGTAVDPCSYDHDPMFVFGPLDDYYLDASSPLIDAGIGNASSICEPVDSNCLSDYTVLVSGVPDSDEVDLGYHRDSVTVPQYILTITVTAGIGNVEAYPEPDAATGKYYPGMIVRLEAIPSRNYRVQSWGGGTLFDYSPSPVSYVIMSSDRDVTIAFEPTAILYVGDDADYPTITSAIHAAGDGDMIIIPTGIWQEPMSNISNGILIDKGVIISSENPDDPDCVANTIIDGLRGTNDYVRGAFTFDFFVTGAVLDGLTIRNCGGRVGHSRNGDRNRGHPNGYDGGWNYGGAIIIQQGADPIIRNCIITDNVAHAGDGGNGSGATNNANAGRGGWGGMALGGAVYCDVSSSPTFENCEITNNSVKGRDGGDGGNYATNGGTGNYGGSYSIAGDFFFDPFSLDITFIEGDLWEVFQSDYFSFGFSFGTGLGYGGDYRWYSGYGGAVYCDQGSVVTFTDCVVTGNRAFGGMSGKGGTIGSGSTRTYEPLIRYVIPSYGGGVYSAAGSTTTFTRCEISDNLAERVGVDFQDGWLAIDTSALPVAYRLDPYLGHGGGVAVEDGSTVVFDDCQISNNEAAIGGGIYWTDDTIMTISDCNVVDNIAYRGAGLHTVKGGDTTSMIIRSLITGNDATVQPEAFPDPDGSDPPVPPEVIFGRGAGLYNASANINIIDSVFARNEVSASGGGIYFSDTNAEV
ncbi:MAG: right-handed parallel beta-helix repeat-containing protein, partial [Deltaproteobacteria bacterium]|nr:right-handed parallel beta-helix repeat-containing protein [Deltaproteobacteria bacterium]